MSLILVAMSRKIEILEQFVVVRMLDRMRTARLPFVGVGPNQSIVLHCVNKRGVCSMSDIVLDT